MKEMQKTYDPKGFEDKIYKMWMDKGSFNAEINKSKTPFTIVLPPPNITGRLHEGHALNHTMQDILIRYKRLKGFEALWVPGTDHASIATEVRILEKLYNETGKTKEDMTRDEFLIEAWKWKKEHGEKIVNQMKKLGNSCDWRRERFTMDEGCNKAVTEVFVRLYEEGLIYKGNRLINWCSDCKTTLSEAEVDHEDILGGFYHIKYFLEDGSEYIEIATTRPETIPGDTAICVHPDDKRYSKFIGKTFLLPLFGRKLKLITDDYIDMEVGTGVLKVTPAHDINDYEIGQRHNLESINCFNEDATLNEYCGKYQGMDRFKARKEIVKDLKEQGYLIKEKPHNHSVGHCYRCNTQIEPRISKQWFVDMQEMGKMAYDSVKKGEMKFIPGHYVKTYNNWLENIQDWCISRQLWWGHQIPAYYCNKCSNIEVSREKIYKCSKCGGSLTQDKDVLDTWFSSALWPFSVFGWPEETPELEYFYPTDVLITGYDIIFFWVVRMMFSGLKHIKKAPFHTTIINGLVRDSKGRKISKSLDNGTDPLEIIDKYGADALRFMLISGTAVGHDTRFSIEKIESARNFANKLHNATRFIMTNINSEIGEIKEDTIIDISDRWMLDKLNTQNDKISNALDKYEFGIAADAIVDFIWNVYCDWYIEISKTKLYSDNEKEKSDKLNILLYSLKKIITLLHPFMPFITEEIWQNLPGDNGDLITSSWPKKDEISDDGISAFESIMESIKRIRNIRKEMDIAFSVKGRILIDKTSKFLDEYIENANYFSNLAGIESVDILDEIPENSASIILEGAKIYFPMDEYLDFEKELDRLLKEQKRINLEIKRAQGKLGNEGFISKAPKKLIDDEKNKKEKYENLLKEVVSKIDIVRKKLK